MRRYGTQAQQLAQGLDQPPNAFNDSMQLSQLELGFLDDTASAVARMDRVVARTNFRAMPFEQRPYLGLTAFYANAGQPAKARAMLARWDNEMTDSITRRVRAADRRAIQGAIDLAEGKYAEALRNVWSADTTYDGPNGNCEVCVLDDIATIHWRAGQTDSAIFYFEKYLNTPFFGRQGFDAGSRPLILKRLGELYEARGNAEQAALRYREFLSLWDRADPRLQPKVEDARRRLSRLADVERRPGG